MTKENLNAGGGHPRFKAILAEIGDLHDKKNHDYASGGDPLGNFHRVASILSHYPNLNPGEPIAVALIYALKQVDAILWGLSNDIEHKVEGLESRLMDVMSYAGIAICELRDNDGVPLDILWASEAKPKLVQFKDSYGFTYQAADAPALLGICHPTNIESNRWRAVYHDGTPGAWNNEHTRFTNITDFQEVKRPNE